MPLDKNIFVVNLTSRGEEESARHIKFHVSVHHNLIINTTLHRVCHPLVVLNATIFNQLCNIEMIEFN